MVRTTNIKSMRSQPEFQFNYVIAGHNMDPFISFHKFHNPQKNEQPKFYGEKTLGTTELPSPLAKWDVWAADTIIGIIIVAPSRLLDRVW